MKLHALTFDLDSVHIHLYKWKVVEAVGYYFGWFNSRFQWNFYCEQNAMTNTHTYTLPATVCCMFQRSKFVSLVNWKTDETFITRLRSICMCVCARVRLYISISICCQPFKFHMVVKFYYDDKFLRKLCQKEEEEEEDTHAKQLYLESYLTHFQR